ncbi:MAG: hypothetical protein ABI559_11195 [Chloroflexota bacterium]
MTEGKGLIELAEEVCAAEGINPPTITWRRWRNERKRGTTGEAFVSGGVRQLSLWTGADKYDRKITLLHELAHLIVGCGQNHNDVFWDKAFELYARYRLTDRALKSEEPYRVGARRAYERRKSRRG